jgi:hypothetical protein
MPRSPVGAAHDTWWLCGSGWRKTLWGGAGGGGGIVISAGSLKQTSAERRLIQATSRQGEVWTTDGKVRQLPSRQLGMKKGQNVGYATGSTVVGMPACWLSLISSRSHHICLSCGF